MSVVGIVLWRSNIWLKKMKYWNLPYLQYRNRRIFTIQTFLISYSGAHRYFLRSTSGLDGCGACGLYFFYNREEASIPVGIRAEGKLSSHGPCGMNIARKKPVFHHCDAPGCLGHARTIQQVMKFWVSATEITNLSEERILNNRLY